MAKKQNERHILNLIYSESKFAEIIEFEQPDFRIKHIGIESYFGVEITEFYYSESNARLRKIPSYSNEIIFEDQYRHKSDKENLKADEFTITTAEGEITGKTRGILQKLPQPDEYAAMVADVIKTKDKKLDQYDHTLTHTNLIIWDAERRLNLVPTEDFYRYFFTDEMKKALYTSSFREIFLVTTLDTSRDVYIPLKMLLLFADFHMFGTLILEYPWETSDESDDELTDNSPSDHILMKTFAKYMRSKTETIYLREKDGEVIFGNNGMVLESGRKTIHDYSDWPLPEDIQTVNDNDLVSFFQSSEFSTKEKEILSSVSFYVELAFNVQSPNHQSR